LLRPLLSDTSKNIDVKNVQIKILKTSKNVKNVTKIKKNVCKRNKKRYLFLRRDVTQCVKKVKVYREAFQVIRHATEKS